MSDRFRSGASLENDRPEPPEPVSDRLDRLETEVAELTIQYHAVADRLKALEGTVSVLGWRT